MVIALAALLAIIPMLVQGPSCGHDFDFHLLSWLEASTQFARFSFPHWAYTPAFNAGEPRFIFYPPLSWSVGAFLGLILPWTLVPAAFTWISLTLSGLTFHALARRYTSSRAATLGAILYLANPYMLFTAYERSAFAELLAAAWLPPLLAAALGTGGCPGVREALSRGPGLTPVPSSRTFRTRILAIAVPIALLWLTNAPAAVMSTYAVAFLTLIRLLTPGTLSVQPSPTAKSRPTSPRPCVALTTAAGTALGLALAAFYILPAAYERRFVQIQMLVIEGMRVSDHFLFHRMPGSTPDDRFHDAVVRTASVVALTLLAASGLALLAPVLRSKSSRSAPELAPHAEMSALGEQGAFSPKQGTLLRFLAKWRTPPSTLPSSMEPIVPVAALALLIALLLTPVSLPIWTHLPDLAFLQFPWRLSALLGLIFAFFTTLALPRKFPALPSFLTHLLCLGAAILLIAPAWHFFHQPCDPEDSVPARVALFHSNLGTEPTDEYTPLQADPDALRPHDPPYWLIPASPTPSQDDSAIDAPPLNAATPGPAPHHLTLNVPTPEYLVLNLRQYPSWQLYLNHTLMPLTAPERRTREDGLIALLLPAGPDIIDVTLIRTPDETLGLAVSALALLLTLYLYFKPRGTALILSPSDTSPVAPA